MLGVMFLLFDNGLHFSLQQVRSQASNIFVFGPFQVIFATAALSIIALMFGTSLETALLVGAVFRFHRLRLSTVWSSSGASAIVQ
jgi:monovalent cation:H+ antiporter-2, CPA2 family